MITTQIPSTHSGQWVPGKSLNATCAAKISDINLIKLCQQGDSSAFEVLSTRYSTRLHAYCYRMSGDHETAEDLVQEVFLKAYRAFPKYHPDYAFYTWLHRIAANCCIDHARKQKYSKLNLSLTSTFFENQGEEWDIPDTNPNPEQRLFHLQVREAMQHLPHNLGKTLALKELEGYSYDEISRAMECSRGTVKSRLFRAREALRKILENAPLH